MGDAQFGGYLRGVVGGDEGLGFFYRMDRISRISRIREQEIRWGVEI